MKNNDTFYSYNGKLLKRDDKDFIIAIWADVPFYIALHKEDEYFISQILSTQFEYKTIEKLLTNERNSVIFNYLIDNKIISTTPQIVNEPIPNYIRDLYYISLQVTSRCNLKCKHCYASAGDIFYDDELSTEQLIDIIDLLSTFSNTEECNFIITGGEPFIRKDIINIISHVMTKFKNVVVVTNGLLLTDDIINELSKITDLKLQISLDGARKETHEYIRGTGTYDKLINNIKKLVSKNIKIALSPICTEIFFNEVDEYFELAKKLNVHTVQLQPVQYIGRARTDSNIKRVDSKKLIGKIVEYYFNEDYHSLIQHGLESISIIHVRNSNRLNNCGTGQGTMYIRSNGDIFSCPNMANDKYVIGNALKENLRDIYYNSKIYNDLRALNINKDFDESCTSCEVKHFCGGGCRGVCLANKNTIYDKGYECESLRAYFNEIIWMVCEHRNFFKEEAKEWYMNKLQKHKEVV